MSSLKQKLKEMAIVAFAVMPHGNVSAQNLSQNDESSASTTQISITKAQDHQADTDTNTSMVDSIVNARNAIYAKNAKQYNGRNPLGSSIRYIGFDDTDLFVGSQHWYEITNKYGTIKYPSGDQPIEKKLGDETRSAAAPELSAEMEAHIKTFCNNSKEDFLIKYYVTQYYINSALDIHLEQNKPTNYAALKKNVQQNQTNVIQKLKKYGINVNPKTGGLQKSAQQNSPSNARQAHVK